MNLDLERQLHVLRSDQDQDYARSTAQLKLMLDTALISQYEDIRKEMAKSLEQVKNLQYSMEQSLEVFKLYMAVSVANCAVISEKFGVPKELAEHCKQRYFIQIAAAKSRQDIMNAGINAQKEIISYFERYSMEGYSHIIKMAIEYIHNNKFRFIYAKDVADGVKTDRSYLSKKFKQEVGINITDYIHQVKIDTAIELMESHMYKLNEISEMLGYANYSYFNKIFKKYKGKAPREYVYK